MKYRSFGKQGDDFKPSALGFGAMCLPSEPLEDYNNPLEEESIKICNRPWC